VLVTNARPRWNGDTFTIRATNTDLPPYQFSSASSPAAGWLQPHSNTDPTVDGVTVVNDPAGLRSSSPPHGIRKVIKITTDERRAFAGRYVRTDLRGPALFQPGHVCWVIAEVYLPPGTPTIPTASDWWTIMEVYGPPYAGPGPLSIQLNRNTAGTGNDFVWRDATGDIRWRSPAHTGVWYIIARKIGFATDTTGYVEIFESHRDPAGNATGPLRIQRLANGQTRWDFATLDSSNDGGPNHSDLKNYHTANMWPQRFVSVYFARHRVYDGATPLQRIDPYYTGLR
jgi:hypothetical protein